MSTLSVELYCRDRAEFPRDEFHRRLRHRLPGSFPTGEDVFFTIEPAQSTFSFRTEFPDLTAAIGQSWQFANAAQVLGECRSILTVTDLAADTLPAEVRLGAFQSVLWTLLEFVHAEAIHCVNSQQIIDPGLFLGEVQARGVPCLTAGALNVRMFEVRGEEEDGHAVMDTMGMSVFGLPDIQCDFRGLQPGAVAQTLFSAAAYVFEQGDVIDTGHTVEGALPGSKWEIRREWSIVAPERPVLDLDPGEPYYAGADSNAPRSGVSPEYPEPQSP
jgi:hypothetical protein